MNVQKIYLSAIAFCCFLPFLLAQSPLRHRFATPDDSIFFFKTINIPKIANDSTELRQILRGGIQQLQTRGYWAASVDSFDFTPDESRIWWHIGAPYAWANLRTHPLDAPLLADAGYRSTDFLSKKFVPKDIEILEKSLLTTLENQGYPFAQITIDSVEIDDGGHISAALTVKKGQYFVIDTLQADGFVRLSSYFLMRYLDLKKGDPLSMAKVERISQRLAVLPFLQEREAPSLTFRENGSSAIRLLLDPKRASRWDFLVGILPSTQANGTQNFVISFNGNADFHNLLGKGERIFANFENLRPQSPRINLKLNYPYLFNSPVGFDGSFDLYKRDTQYLETHFNIGAQLLRGGFDHVKIFWHRYAASNLLINAAQIVAQRRLPATLDVNSNSFGLEWSMEKLDYRFNPRRGFAFLLRGSVGSRTVRPNADILNLSDRDDPNFSFSTLYDTVTLRNFPFTLHLKTDLFLPVARRAVVKIGLQAAGIFSSAPISLNEQYRIGGTRILRGFNEEGIFATRYALGTFEYRLLIGRNSYLYAFADGGYVADISRTTTRSDTPIGIGGGVVFETKVGLFGFTVAAGREQSSGFDFRNLKTHFGYVSMF